MMSRALVCIIAICLASPAMAQKSPFVGETVWGCKGDHSATKKWRKTPGASKYQVKTHEDGVWVDVDEDEDTHTFDLNEGETTILYVRPVIDGNPGEESTVTVRQVGDAGDPDGESCPKAGPYGWDDNYGGGGSGTGLVVPEGMAVVMIDGRPVLMPEELARTCLMLPANIVVSGTGADAECRRLGASGVAVPHLIAQGVIDAVDLWGHITDGTEVCFRQPGRLTFLDAATSPRQEATLSAYQRDGMTCAAIDRPGTVVLLRGQPQPTETDHQQVDAQQSEPAQAPLLRPQECRRISTNTNVRLRREPPDGETLFVIAPNEVYPTKELRDGYYKVRHFSMDGWISAAYVTVLGACRYSN